MTRRLYTTQVEIPPGMISFGVGHPGWSLLPLDLMREATEHRLSQGDSLMLNYGPEQGDGRFLEALAAFLAHGYAAPVDPLSLMVSGGASQALNMICTFFTEPGDTIFVEEPTYFIAPLIFSDHRLNIVPIPMDDQGLDIDTLEEKLDEYHPRFVYTIPVYQNPTGATLTMERRQRLLELSVERDFLIVADEVYQLLNYTADPPPPFGTMIEADTVLSVGSFSKILGPGLRLGWIQAGPKLIDKLVGIQFIYSGGSVAQYVSHLMRSALELGLQQAYLRDLRTVYRNRCQALCAALEAEMGSLLTFRKPDGGYFVWGELADGFDANALLPAAIANQVSYQPGVNFSSRQGLHNYIRFCFAHYDEDDLAEGVRRLAQVFAEQLG